MAFGQREIEYLYVLVRLRNCGHTVVCCCSVLKFQVGTGTQEPGRSCKRVRHVRPFATWRSVPRVRTLFEITNTTPTLRCSMSHQTALLPMSLRDSMETKRVQKLVWPSFGTLGPCYSPCTFPCTNFVVRFAELSVCVVVTKLVLPVTAH